VAGPAWGTDDRYESRGVDLPSAEIEGSSGSMAPAAMEFGEHGGRPRLGSEKRLAATMPVPLNPLRSSLAALLDD
jgi:hypothetical protein